MNFTTADIKVLEAAFSFSESQEMLLLSVCSVQKLLWGTSAQKCSNLGLGRLPPDSRTTRPDTPRTNCSRMSKRTKSWPPNIDGTGWEKSSPASDLMDSSNTPQDTQRGPVSMPPGGSEPDLIHYEADVKIISINLKSKLKSWHSRLRLDVSAVVRVRMCNVGFK